MPGQRDIFVCSECRKLFAAVYPVEKCPECAAEEEQKIYLVENAIYYALKRSLEDIIEYTRLPEDEVLKILKDLRYLNEAVESKTLCSRCKEEPAQPGSRFCLDCRLELHSAMGQAAGAMAEKIGKKAYRPTDNVKIHNVVAEFQKKRQRTSADSLRPRQSKFK